MTAKHIKECFVSRFPNGKIVEADFSQLEVIAAAVVSGDPMMKKDIRDGIDSHCQSAAWLNPKYCYSEILDGYRRGDEYFTKLRKNAKAPRFELQYGAGARSIAENNGLTLSQAQGFIDRYYDRYKVLKQFQTSVAEEVLASKERIKGKFTLTGHQISAGIYQSITGRIYYFEEDSTPEFLQNKGIHTSFSPTAMKNYPIQGFATGDIVPEMLGRITRALLTNGQMYDILLPINTIHDSIIFDLNPNILEEDTYRSIHNFLSIHMSTVPQAMKERFGLDIDMNFPIDIELGDDWFSLQSIKSYL